MSASPSQELLEAVATELAVDPSFIEKDWHATQIIAGITTRGSAEPAPVFSGGTSLSKGYGLIRRFSEDLDFKLLLPGSGIDRDARPLGAVICSVSVMHAQGLVRLASR